MSNKEAITKRERAEEFADSLDEILQFRETPIGTILVLGLKDNRFKYMEFKDWVLSPGESNDQLPKNYQNLKPIHQKEW
jgi:hypothetical protein